MLAVGADFVREWFRYPQAPCRGGGMANGKGWGGGFGDFGGGARGWRKAEIFVLGRDFWTT